MTRGGQKKRPEEPERRCIVTRETQPKGGLIRFVVAPDRMIVADILGKLPGRGIWVAADRVALEKAVRMGLFTRAAKERVNVPDHLADQVENALADRVIHLISLARKAGQAVAGYEKVKSWLMTGEARVLLQASDGSERGKSKLRAPEGDESFVGVLSGQELGLAFGRENVIHGALAAGGLSKRVVDEAARLQGLRMGNGGMSVGKDRRPDER